MFFAVVYGEQKDQATLSDKRDQSLKPLRAVT